MNYDLTWGLFLAAATAVFLPLELKGTSDGRGKNYGTLSATLRRWMGIDPPAPRRWWTRIAFSLALVVFGIHIVTPWL